jgi:Holliday junction resolvase
MQALHFQTSRPVEGDLFVNRTRELQRLDAALGKLKAGRSDFLAVLGLRKQGKSSLFQEWMRRHTGEDGIAFVPIQCWAWPDPEDFFREYARVLVNAVLAATGSVHEAGLLAATASPGRLVELAAFAVRKNRDGLRQALQFLADYQVSRDRASVYRTAIRLPETVAAAERLRLQFVLDEFQELAGFDGFQAIRKGFGSVFAMLREEWQQQRRCNYIVSGSAVSLLRQIIDAPSAPFFQHFTSLHLGPLPEPEAIGLLVRFSRESGAAIPEELCRRMAQLVGTNPYYLQILGEEMVLGAGGRGGGQAPDEDEWKRVCQKVVLQPSGRLYQYFEQIHQKVAGRSSLLEKVLVALAEGPGRGSAIAAAVGVTQNRLGSKLPVLEAQDVMVKTDAGYALCDPCYALWLKASRGPAAPVAAPLLLGEASERRVAEEAARQGVGLVYQSRASRGAFDLLAVYQTHQIGVQVKKVRRFPVYLSEREIGRMRHEARALGWHAVLAFDHDDGVSFHALDQGTVTKRGRRYATEIALRHLLDVLSNCV